MNISVQVLDGVYGQSAARVGTRLQRAYKNEWLTIADAETNDDGYVKDWDSRNLDRGRYRIVFDSDSYFARLGANTAYPEVIIIFKIPAKFCIFQIQIILASCSYSTYFGTVRQAIPDESTARCPQAIRDE